MHPVYYFYTHDCDPNPGNEEWTPRFRCVGKWAMRIALRALFADGWDYVSMVVNDSNETDVGPSRCEEIPLSANYYNEVA